MHVAAVQEEEAPPVRPAPTGERSAGVLGSTILWLAIAVAGDLGEVVAHLAGVDLPTWMPALQIGLLAALALGAARWLRDAHLHRFVWALAAILAGDWLAGSVEAGIGWFQTATRAQAMFARVFLTYIPTGLAAITVVGSGLSRRDLFLARGDMKAPSRLPLLRGVRWSTFAPVLLAVISAGLIVQLWIVGHASDHFRPLALLGGLVPAVVFAALNAVAEEFRFRNVLLAHGTRAVGAAQAIAATSLLFGLAHFGGHPSGFTGVAMAAFLAWVLARSMFDTRGWGWALLFHFVQDVLIFLMVVMTGV